MFKKTSHWQRFLLHKQPLLENNATDSKLYKNKWTAKLSKNAQHHNIPNCQPQIFTARRVTTFSYFGIELSSCLIKNRQDKFLSRFNSVDNLFCRYCCNLWFFFVLLCSELIFLFLLPCIVYHWCWWIKLIKNAKFGLFGITKCRLTSLWLCVAAPDNHQCRRLRFSVWCLTVLHKKFVDFDSGDWLFFLCILYFVFFIVFLCV